MTIRTFYPEMGEPAPVAATAVAADVEAVSAMDGKHYILKTTTVLGGRGVEYVQTYKPEDLTPFAQKYVGWKVYRATTAAFQRIGAATDIRMQVLLD